MKTDRALLAAIMPVSFMLLVIFMFVISGCRSQPQDYMLSKEEAQKERIKEKSGVANPATLHCMNTTGATWQLKEGPAGQYGKCTFPDGSWCEEWAYYNGYCEPGMNMTTCSGQFWGKSTCPPDHNPVCAYLNQTDGWKTFNNACKACLPSEGSAEGYVMGVCE